MPTSEQHAVRVAQGLACIKRITAEAALEKDCINPVATEHFYTALHMFEAAVYDFPDLTGRKLHFNSHSSRTEFLNTFVFAPRNSLLKIAPHYESLRELSERARYLSPARLSVYQPLKPADLASVKQIFQQLSAAIESIYGSRGQPIPWQKK